MQFGGFASRWQGCTENISYNHDFYSGGVTYTKMLLLFGPYYTQPTGRQCFTCIVFEKCDRFLIS
jgi:hypothetical protein